MKIKKMGIIWERTVGDISEDIINKVEKNMVYNFLMTIENVLKTIMVGILYQIYFPMMMEEREFLTIY